MSTHLPRLAIALVAGLQDELDLSPKPGLVDRWDNGSHTDLNYRLMQRSIRLLETYFLQCTVALQQGRSIERLRELGITAERRMLKALGTNTHRGAIFQGGLLLAAVHTAGTTNSNAVSAAVAAAAEQLFAAHLPDQTTGSQVRVRYGVGGIIREALDGFPTLFKIAYPALQQAKQSGYGHNQALYLAMARLMQTLEDTTALRRCGQAGLAQLKHDGRQLENLLLNRHCPIRFLINANRRYQRHRLTMGGVADILALSSAWMRFKIGSKGIGLVAKRVIAEVMADQFRTYAKQDK